MEWFRVIAFEFLGAFFKRCSFLPRASKKLLLRSGRYSRFSRGGGEFFTTLGIDSTTSPMRIYALSTGASR